MDLQGSGAAGALQGQQAQREAMWPKKTWAHRSGSWHLILVLVAVLQNFRVCNGFEGANLSNRLYDSMPKDAPMVRIGNERMIFLLAHC